MSLLNKLSYLTLSNKEHGLKAHKSRQNLLLNFQIPNTALENRIKYLNIVPTIIYHVCVCEFGREIRCCVCQQIAKVTQYNSGLKELQVLAKQLERYLRGINFNKDD